MRLSDFIRETLYEIALGIDHARIKSHQLIAINPAAIDGEKVVEKGYVEFDVSVVVADSTDAKKSGSASAEIQVSSFIKIGGRASGELEHNSSAKTEQTHRVSFKVPVYMAASYKGNPAAKAEAEAFNAGRKAEKASAG